MALTVDFITLGDASEELGVPSPTLRHWTQQLEDFNVHYVKRNNRNERIYYESDLEIFAYLRDLKAEYGRKTTTKDLSYMVADKGKKGEFILRTKEDAPSVKQSNRTRDLLSQEDIQQLMQSERVKQFIGVIIDETTKNLKDELIEEIRDTVREEIREEIKTEMEANNTKMEEIAKRMEQSVAERDKQTLEFFKKSDEKREAERKQREEEEANKGFFARLFGK